MFTVEKSSWKNHHGKLIMEYSAHMLTVEYSAHILAVEYSTQNTLHGVFCTEYSYRSWKIMI